LLRCSGSFRLHGAIGQSSSANNAWALVRGSGANQLIAVQWQSDAHGKQESSDVQRRSVARFSISLLHSRMRIKHEERK